MMISNETSSDLDLGRYDAEEAAEDARYASEDRAMLEAARIDRAMEAFDKAMNKEAMIMWNRVGGRFSFHLNDVTRVVRAALEACETPDFPNTRWNDTVVLREKMIREGAGIVG